uniref:Uncharacterized protein n=1 Tax=Trypanosoma congolense (strain IL3000) TaxID=1068625 RepID=G0UQJ5_TRYCI|nr:conserved hypothetical protein [Trypanosoma congolense IL3000]
MSFAGSSPASEFYVLQKKGRVFPNYDFTQRAIIAKRTAENTTALAISVGFLIPTMAQVHLQLERLALERDDIPLGKVVTTMVEAAKDNMVVFLDKLARLAVQTGVACWLSCKRNAYCNSVIYLWNMYPSLHHYYSGEMIKFLKLPRFLSTLFGPKGSDSDVRLFQQDILPAAAAEDSLKRAAVDFVADVTVDAVRVFVPPWILRVPFVSVKRRLELFFVKTAMYITAGAMKVTGAGIGRAVAGHRGEYWGEIAGAGLAPFIFARIADLFPRSTRRRTAGGSLESVRGRSRTTGKESERGRSRSTGRESERGRSSRDHSAERKERRSRDHSAERKERSSKDHQIAGREQRVRRHHGV